MSIGQIIVYMIVAAICGSIGAAIAGRDQKGCLTNIALGFIGALLGGYLSRELGVADLFYFRSIPVIWTVIGSALFVAVLGLVGGKKHD
jgi:uncharacterized membrane protein YeaQ/YmgE (transglycosylase-associated protein family)